MLRNFSIELALTAICLYMYVKLGQPQPILKTACWLGFISVPVAALGWLLSRNESMSAIGLMPAGVSVLLMIVATFKGERVR